MLELYNFFTIRIMTIMNAQDGPKKEQNDHSGMRNVTSAERFTVPQEQI